MTRTRQREELGQNYAYPIVHRTAHGKCYLCSRESAHCCRINLRTAGIWSKPFVACASCRVANFGRWVVSRGWQDEYVEEHEWISAKGWKEWQAANPPLDDEIERINREEKSYGR